MHALYGVHLKIGKNVCHPPSTLLSSERYGHTNAKTSALVKKCKRGAGRVNRWHETMKLVLFQRFQVSEGLATRTRNTHLLKLKLTLILPPICQLRRGFEQLF